MRIDIGNLSMLDAPAAIFQVKYIQALRTGGFTVGDKSLIPLTDPNYQVANEYDPFWPNDYHKVVQGNDVLHAFGFPLFIILNLQKGNISTVEKILLYYSVLVA